MTTPLLTDAEIAEIDRLQRVNRRAKMTAMLASGPGRRGKGK